jgi:ribosomal protein S1
MGKRIKFKPTGKSWGPDDGFDWSLYEDGYDGGTSLRRNTKVKTHGNDIVYSHEPYAQELYDLMEDYFSGRKTQATPKDSKSGVVYNVQNISALSDHEVVIDSDNGMSAVVDLNKEAQFVKHVGFNRAADFTNALKDDKFREELVASNLLAKVIDSNRVSIWEGYKSRIEKEFMEDLLRKDGPKYAYLGKVVSANPGGYTVDIMGLNCFMPASLASNGPISDPESLVGTELKCCVVNYASLTKNFVVSHKKYIETTLPARIREELYVGKPVFVKVTGVSKNGLFCAIKDSEGKWMFSSLMHRTTMSNCFEEMFDEGQFVAGDEFRAYVHKLNWGDGDSCRIVIGDNEPVETEKEELVKE